MDGDRAQQARHLLALTREMLELARAKDWPALAMREAERQQTARELFASPVPPEAATAVADCIRELLNIDQELIVLTEAGREEAAQAMNDVRTGQKARDAYRRFSR